MIVCEDEVRGLKVLNILGLFYKWTGVLTSMWNIRLGEDGSSGEVSGVLCNERISMRLNDKFCKSVLRPTMLCASEVEKKIEQRMN